MFIYGLASAIHSVSPKQREKYHLCKDTRNTLYALREITVVRKDIPRFCKFLMTSSCSMGWGVGRGQTGIIRAHGTWDKSPTPSPWSARPAPSLALASGFSLMSYNPPLAHLLSKHTSHPADGKPATTDASRKGLHCGGTFSHHVPAILKDGSDKILLPPQKNLLLV